MTLGSMLGRAWRWVPAALVAGLLFGIGSRFVMRGIAQASGLDAGFSLGGSVEVVVFGALVGAPAALVFFLVRGLVPVSTPLAGIMFGVLLLVVFALVPPPAARSALEGTPDPPVLTAALFGILFVLYGAALDVWWTRAETAP